jgi:4-amino-4-deoxy-L-arabinose transferase-like glycosyltransferase
VVVFALVYAIAIGLTSGGMSIHWDEINHLNGPLQLTRGQIWEYVTINSFYPPLYNLVTAAYFFVAGASVFTARLVSLTFTVLLIVLVYVTAKDMYNPKVGLAAAVFFAVMPGIVWLSSLAMAETLLIFLVAFSLVLFFRWLQTGRKIDLSLSLAAFALGVVAKYQTLIVVPLVMLAGLLVLGKKEILAAEFNGFRHSRRVWLLVPLAIGAIVTVVVFYVSGLLEDWLYAVQVGNVGQTEYSLRFPAPVFYLVEMVWPFSESHPVSLVPYVLGLAGLVFLAARRKPQDKYLLAWFLVTYIVFTLIPNRVNFEELKRQCLEK